MTPTAARAQAIILAAQIRALLQRTADLEDELLTRLLQVALAECNIEIHGDVDVELGKLSEVLTNLRNALLADFAQQEVSIAMRWRDRTVKERLLLRKCLASIVHSPNAIRSK